jgi:5'-nucleotidase
MSRIVVDLDAIVTNIFTPWLTKYNHKYDDWLNVKDIHDWDMSKVVKPECGEKIFEFVREPNFFLELNPLSGAIEGLKALHDDQYDLVICSAPETEHAAQEKLLWVKEWLPFIGKGNTFIGKRKGLIRAEAIIDDAPHNLIEFAKGNPLARIITIAYPYNQNVQKQCDLAAESYRDTTAAWEQIVAYVRKTL